MLERYADLLLDWNRKVNLTGARSRRDLAAHLDDALSWLRVPWTGVQTVIDIGSGGGLPAVPLALRLPAVRFSLLEADRRKVAFLQHVAGTLALANVEVIQGRAEMVAHLPQRRERFDRAIARAAARPPILLELAIPFVRPGGDLVAAVGAIDLEPLAAVCHRLGGGDPSLLAVERRGRFLLLVPKRGTTPAAYPRAPGRAQRFPLGGQASRPARR